MGPLVRQTLENMLLSIVVGVIFIKTTFADIPFNENGGPEDDEHLQNFLQTSVTVRY